MLKVENLTKSFGELLAVDHISFEVMQGEIFGFLGPNGAGKTTTINMMCGLLKPETGSISIDGINMVSAGPKLRREIGVVPQEVALYEELNAIENLRFWGGLYGMRGSRLKQRIEELIQLCDLKDRAKDRVQNYSGGMKRRLNLAAGLIHQPKLLLLDEPTVGIDPQARHLMLEMVQGFAKEGTTIIYTTHYMDEAEALCKRLAIIDHGHLLAMGTQDELKQIVGENRLLKVTGLFKKKTAEEMPEKIKDLSLISIGEQEVLYSLPVKYGTGQFLEKLVQTGFQIDNLAVKEPNLDSVFIKLTGRELRD